MPEAKPSAASRAQIWAVVYFVAATAFLVWPLFFWLGNFVEPRVFGLPWALIYVLLVIAANFAVLTWLYRRGVVDAEEPDVETETTGARP